MFQVRVHGRGGQGAVATAELLSMAAFADGQYAQAFASVGAERPGAPVEAYCRIARHPIRAREPVHNPDAVILQEAALRRHVDVLAGLAPAGWLVVNSVRCWDALGLSHYSPRLSFERTVIVPATDLAMAHIGRPLPGAALLGAFAAATGQVGLDALAAAIRRRFAPQLAELNVAAACAAYQRVGEPAHA